MAAEGSGAHECSAHDGKPMLARALLLASESTADFLVCCIWARSSVISFGGCPCVKRMRPKAFTEVVICVAQVSGIYGLYLAKLPFQWGHASKSRARYGSKGYDFV